MSVKIQIQFNGKSLTIPINPEEITISQKATNTNLDIIGLGKTARKGEPELITLEIESFFPAQNSYFYTGVLPKTCVEFIQEIWNTENINNKVAKIVTSGLPKDINMYFVIDSFSYDHRAGEEEDIYYKLNIKQYRAYGVKTVTNELSGLAAARSVSPAIVDTGTNTPNTYTVQSGDCLWNIAKACTGNGANWPALYELNKAVIGSNPNLIKLGQVLTLPDGWASPQNVPKLTSISKSSSNNSSSAEKPTFATVMKETNFLQNKKTTVLEDILGKPVKVQTNNSAIRDAYVNSKKRQ